MNQLLFAIAAVLLVFLGAVAGLLSSVLELDWSVPSDSGVPIEVVPAMIDLGHVVEGPCTAQGLLRNKTNVSLRIVDVQTSCSCSSAEFSAEVIPPASDVRFRLMWDLRNAEGETYSAVDVSVASVADEDPDSLRSNAMHSLTIPLKADVAPEWTATPNPLVFQSGVSAVKELLVNNISGDQITVLSVSTSHDALHAVIKDTDTQKSVVRVSFDPSLWRSPGPASVIVTTSSEIVPTKMIPVWVTRLSDD